MREQGSVCFGNTAISFDVRRSQRRKKTVQISVNGDGVHVAAPMTMPDSELWSIVRKRAAWILNRTSQAVLEAAPKHFLSGETLPYLGRNVQMTVESADLLRVVVPRDLDGVQRHESIYRALVGWYRSRAVERLAFWVERWWPRLGWGGKSRVLIRDQRRLASSPVISFSLSASRATWP